MDSEKVYQGLLALDKDLKHLEKWTGTTANLTVNSQVYWKHIAGGWKDDKTLHPLNMKDSYRLTLAVFTDYYHGQIMPSVFIMYDPEGTWMTNASIKYSPDTNWYYEITQMSFWGNRNAVSDFATYGLIDKSEISFRIGYKF